MCTGRVSTLDTSNYVGPEDRVTKDKMRVRAAASRFHSAGADGVYTFNWHANRDSRRDLITQVGSSDTADAYADYVSDVSSAVWLRSEFNPSEISKGPHQVQVMLQERNPKLACDIVLTNVELVIAYGKGQPLAAGANVAT